MTTEAERFRAEDEAVRNRVEKKNNLGPCQA